MMQDLLYLALPDGHQQRPTMEFLQRAGFEVAGYEEPLKTYRPKAPVAGMAIKVIRPQDMPMQVANGNFDLAVTGRDWLLDHRYRFPSSPVGECTELGFGKVSIVAVVSKELGITSSSALRELVQKGRFSQLRIASEYVNIADKYARDNRLGRYKVIPTYGATEAFIPEDADVLVENTETGTTLARNNLIPIELLFTSTACLIGSLQPSGVPEKDAQKDYIIELFRRAASTH